MTDARKIISRVELNLHPMDGAVVSNLRCTVGVKNTDAIIAALSAAGLVIVPKEPTEKMKQAWTDAAPSNKQALLVRWRACLEAATDD